MYVVVPVPVFLSATVQKARQENWREEGSYYGFPEKYFNGKWGLGFCRTINVDLVIAVWWCKVFLSLTTHGSAVIGSNVVVFLFL